jgi:dTDP-4-amino-4,6-dideoxygalactose transaminase
MISPSDQQRLAIDGGTPAFAGEQPRWPPQDVEIREALEQAWADGSWGRYHAEPTERLTAELARRHQAEFVTLCASGTFAVELALRSLSIGPGDEVILAGYDFPGNFRAIEAIGARPVLVDIAQNGWLMDIEQMAAAVSDQTRAVVVSHLHGGLVDLPRVLEMAARYKLLVVEDACQVPGAILAGRSAGGWGHVGVLSFGGSKLLTAGRGGAVLTNNLEAHQRSKIFCQRGNDAFPLSQLQAAVLVPQLERLDERNIFRVRAARRLITATCGLPGLRPIELSSTVETALYKVPWRYVAEELGNLPIEQFLAALVAEGVPMDTGFRGFAGRGERRCRKVGDLPYSRRASETTLLLHHPVLLESDDRIDALAQAITKVVRAYSSSSPASHS